MTRILVVEDSPLIQLATKCMFKSFDCVVDFAKTGKETLNLLEKNHYDILFLDLGLPDISGLDLAKKIRENKQMSELRLIVLTAQGSNCKQECEAVGIQKFYTKPLTEKDISEILLASH